MRRGEPAAAGEGIGRNFVPLYPEALPTEGIGRNYVTQYPEPPTGKGIGGNFVPLYPEPAAGIAIMRIYGLVDSPITRYNGVILCEMLRALHLSGKKD